jgi:hypothetical protein
LVVLYFEEGTAVLVAEGTVIHEKPLQLAVRTAVQRAAIPFVIIYLIYLPLLTHWNEYSFAIYSGLHLPMGGLI